MHFILGGNRSGKSSYAQALAVSSGLRPVYFATAQALDEEMSARILRHQQDRDERWGLVESPVYLARALKANDDAGSAIVIDCLTLWVTNLLMAEEGQQGILEQEVESFFEVLPQMQSRLMIVSNEVGFGVIPMGELTRRFCDEVGFIHQRLAAQSEKVTLMVAGIAHSIKDESPGD